MSADEAQAAVTHANELLQRDPAAALRGFERAAALARSAGVSGVEAEAEFGIGAALYTIDGREQESIPHLERAAALGAGTVTGALSHMTLGDVWRFMRNGDESLRAYERSAESFMGLGDVTGELLARRGMSEILQALDRETEALPQLARAVILASEDGDGPEYAQLALRLGALLGRLGRKSDAVEVFTEAANAYRQLGELELEAQALSEALTLEGTGGPPNYDIMIRLGQIAAQHAANEGDAEAEGVLHQSIASLEAERASLRRRSDD